MKTFNKFLVILISMTIAWSGLIAQADVKQTSSDQQEIKEKLSEISSTVNTNEGIDNQLTDEQKIQIRMQQETIPVLQPQSVPFYGKGTDELCTPLFTAGCIWGDGFTDFAVEQIQNYNSGCADNTGFTGWSTYHNLGPAILLPGMSYDFTMATGFPNQYVNIWIDFNNDEILTANEIILQDFYLANSGTIYTANVTIPANATPGQHKMRAMMVYASSFTDPCGSYYYGEAEDYTVIVGIPAYGTLEGFVTENTGGAPVQGAQVSVGNGMYTATTAANGFYQISNLLVGTWNVSVTKTGYNPATASATITENVTTTQNFALTAPTMNISPLTINVIVEPDSTETEMITIANTGDGQLAWNALIQFPNTFAYPLYSEITNGLINTSIASVNSNGLAPGPAPNSLKDFEIKLDPNSTAYAYNAYDPSFMIPEGPITFTLNNPGVLTPFGTAASNFVATAEWVDDVWYGVVYGGTWITIDMVTGIPTVIGPCADFSGIAYDWTTQTMYGVTFSGGLYSINITTGASTMIASTQAGLITMVCTNEGNLYGFDLNADTFGSIDKVTGQWTSINYVGFDFSYAQDASVDRSTNTIYWACYDVMMGGVLLTVDAQTGVTSFIGAFQNSAEVTGFAIPGSPDTWITIDLKTGIVNANGTGTTNVIFDATDIIPGTVKNANIVFTSNPNVGTVSVPVSMTVGSQQFGQITGTVTLTGNTPYNNGDITEVLVQAGPYSTNPDVTGAYTLSAYPGTYDVTATLYGYTQQVVTGVIVSENLTTPNINFTMPCINGIIEGTVTALTGGLPIEGAAISLLGTDFTTTTATNGTYQFIVEAGTYDVKVSVSGYASQTATDVIVTAQTITTQSFVLEDLEGIIVIIDLDPTPNTALTSVVEGFFPNGLIIYTTSVTGYPLDQDVQTVFLLLGIYANNHVLTAAEANIIKTWIDTYPNRNLYMEGGDTWAFDAQTPLHAYFNINPIADGSADLFNVEGIASFWDGFTWSYNGENNWIDRISAIPPAINVMQNPAASYFCGVAHDGGTYKTVGASFEITGLNDGNGSFAMGVACVMGWFGYPVFTYGTLEGTITESGSGLPIEGVTVEVGSFGSAITLANGTYTIANVLTGNWTAIATKEGYNTASAPVTITENQITFQNFVMTAPTFNLAPSSITITLEPNETGSESVMLSNTGTGPVNWNANLNILSKDETGSNNVPVSYPLYADVIGNFTPVKAVSENSSGRASQPAPYSLKDYEIKLDPTSTAYAYNAYDPSFTIPEGPVTFTLNNPGVLNPFGPAASDFVATADWVNDVWYGVIYGGTWITIDMVTGIPSVIGPCGDFTGIAYDWTTQTMYGVDFNGGLYTVDLATGASTMVASTQANLITMVCTNEGNLYGFDLNANTFGSIDKVTGQWTSINYVGFDFSYAQDACVDHSTNTIYWACYDVNLGGVLLTVDAQTGVTSFIGSFPNGAEITGFAIPGAFDTWVTIDTYSGVLNAGDSFPLMVNFDATDMLPGVFEAEITFTTNPNVGTTVVDVTMIVEGLIPAVNLTVTHSCTDVNLTWQMPTGGDADSWNVYRNGDLIGNTTAMTHGDLLVMPAQEHCYQVRAVYDGEESMPTAPACITVPTPTNLQPLTLQGQHLGGGNVQLTWNAPSACVSPDEFKIFRNNNLIATTDEQQYLDEGLTTGNYEYYLKAVYYFGESGNSTPTYVMVIITDISEISDDQINLYPNPASDIVYLESGSSVISVEIYNNAGQLVRSRQINDFRAQIDVGQFEPGLYYFKLNTAEGTVLKKILVD